MLDADQGIRTSQLPLATDEVSDKLTIELLKGMYDTGAQLEEPESDGLTQGHQECLA